MISLNEARQEQRRFQRSQTQSLADQLQKEMLTRREQNLAEPDSWLQSIGRAVEKHPEIAVGTAAAIGLLIGIVFRRRR